uniref:Carbonic anhydrase n=1 Tax=Strigamia maritima TaxID=126957 RepID=T1ISC0_STRMM
MTTWGYTKGNGPHTWLETFPAAKGNLQSPIDISTADCINASDDDQPLKIRLSFSKIRNVVNTGYGFRVDVDSEDSELSGGPLQNKYRVEQFHFHWGRDDKTGSEHTIDGVAFPSEVHLVHWNAEKYASFSEAASKDDGLAVLGVLIQVGEKHEEMSKLIDLLPNIRFKGDKTSFDGEFDLSTLLPDMREYWTYPGSLTTPPCSENVAWIVFKQPIEFSSDQLTVFRDLCSYCECDQCPDDEFGGQIVDNFRPPLPIGDRVVRECKF